MAVIDDYYYELEGRIEKAKSEEEIEILQREARGLYFPPEGRNSPIVKGKSYPVELTKYYIDKESFVSDLKGLGTSYNALGKALRMKTTSIRGDKKGYYVYLLDEQLEKIQELCGLDVKLYTLSTEPAGRQPQRPINAGPIKEALEIKGIKKYKLSMDLYDNTSALDAYINKEAMPLHRAKELCDILGLEHSEVIIKES